MITILVVLLVLSVFTGAAGTWWAPTQHWGPYSWSPLAVLLVIVLVLWFGGFLTGPASHLHRWR